MKRPWKMLKPIAGMFYILIISPVLVYEAMAELTGEKPQGGR